MKTYQPNETTLTRGFDPLGSWLRYWGGLLTIGLALLVISYGTDPIVWLIIGAFAITGLVVVRQIIALRENSQLLAERAARAAEARFVSLIEQSSDVITVIEANGKVLYESPSLERVFGYSIPELLGESLVEFIHPDSRAEATDLVARLCKKSGMRGRLELRLLHKDGQYVDVEAVMTNLLDDPNIRGIVINSRNIAERKQAEAALHESEELLHQSQKMEDVGKIADRVAHDFNNLLAVISGYSDMLLKRTSTLTENAQRKIELISKAAHEAAGLTRQLQALSREQVLQPKRLDLNSVVGDMDQMLKRDPSGCQPLFHVAQELDDVRIV